MVRTKPPTRVGVVGLGQGRAHLSAFQTLPESTVLAVADLRNDVRDRVADEFEVPRRYATLDELLTDREIDLVVIATPDHLHGAHSIAALEAGKHVLSEIPMATSVEECAAIIELCARTGLRYQMGQQVRYAHCLQDVRRLIADGEMGEVFYGEGEYLHSMTDHIHAREPDHWRVHGPVPQTTLLGGGPHALDTLRWLMGVRFTRTSAFHAAQTTGFGTIHTTVAIFSADTGATAKVTSSYGMVRPYCLYFSVYGSEGSFERTRDQGEGNGHTTNYLVHSRLGGANRMIPVELANFTNPALREIAQGTGHGTMELEQAQRFLYAVRNDHEPDLGPRAAAESIVPLICAQAMADAGGGTTDIPSM